jgi:hypothetical protein
VPAAEKRNISRARGVNSKHPVSGSGFWSTKRWIVRMWRAGVTAASSARWGISRSNTDLSSTIVLALKQCGSS